MGMAEYIERDTFLKMISHKPSSPTTDREGRLINGFISAVKNFPAANVRPVVRGFNVRKAYPSLFECSQCGWGCDDTYYCDTPTFNFCPNCGADMREES